jgi:hypothetical protein
MTQHLGESLGTDFFSVREQFTDEQWSHFIATRRFVDEEVVPVVGPYWERAEICWPLVRRLPDLAQMTKLGAFALTEPEHGSGSVALETEARPDGDHWVLNVRKRWIGLGTVGTETMQTLIVGRAVTGIGAFT